MKKWQERTLFILGLGLVGTLAFALRPAFLPNQCHDDSEPGSLVSALSGKYDNNPSFSCDYVWDFSRHPSGTVLMDSLDPDAFSFLQEARWKIHLRIKDGKLEASYDTPQLQAKSPLCQVKTNYLVQFMQPPTFRQMPNGDLHKEHNLFLLCEATVIPPFWGKPVRTFAIQNLKIDFTDGCVDISEPNIPFELKQKTKYKTLENGIVPDLPRRYCGSPAEQGLLRVLYGFCDIRSVSAAEFQAKRLKELAEDVVSRYSDADKPWPDCWGDDADAARRGSERVVLSLVRMQENDCYKSKTLADFINGPIFARIFGESFKNAPLPAPKVQTEPIEFREVSQKEFEAGEQKN